MNKTLKFQLKTGHRAIIYMDKRIEGKRENWYRGVISIENENPKLIEVQEKYIESKDKGLLLKYLESKVK